MSQYIAVAPREGRVSRNSASIGSVAGARVAPREGRVSRNFSWLKMEDPDHRRAPRGACE